MSMLEADPIMPWMMSALTILIGLLLVPILKPKLACNPPRWLALLIITAFVTSATLMFIRVWAVQI